MTRRYREDRRARRDRRRQRRPVISGFILLGIGLFLLLANLNALQYTWPIFIIIVGVALIAGSFVNKSDGRHATPPPGTPSGSPPPPPPPTY